MHDREIEVHHSWTLEQWDWPLLRSANQNGELGVQNMQYFWELNVDASIFIPTK